MADADFASAFKELMELQQKIDTSARRLLDGAKVLVAHRAEYQPVRADDYPDRDAAYYDGTAAELAAAGVSVLGDFTDAAFNRRHPDRRAFIRLGLTADGTIGANWFVLGPNRSLVLQTWLADGRTVLTVRSGVESTYPRPPETLAQHVGPDVATADLIALHRRRVTEAGSEPRALHGQGDLLAAYAAHEEGTARFRERLGPEIVEQSLRKKLGKRYEAQGAPLVAAIAAHPEWWTGAAPPPADAVPQPRLARVKFLASRDADGRLHITTLGLMMHFLPELQMKRVAANHSRAARFLMGVVARRVLHDVPHGPLPSPFDLTLTRDEVAAANPFIVFGRYPEVSDPSEPVPIRLILEGFGEKHGLLSIFRRDPELLHVMPPSGYAGDKDEWLRHACRNLGHDAPLPLQREALDTEMAAASRRAREMLSAFRERLHRGLPPDHTLLVKTALSARGGGHEYVWIKVREWEAGALIGTLKHQPRAVDGYKRGQEMRLLEADVFDVALHNMQRGVFEGGLTDVVAEEFGVDL